MKVFLLGNLGIFIRGFGEEMVRGNYFVGRDRFSVNFKYCQKSLLLRVNSNSVSEYEFSCIR